jgi:AcrR family transcriptional regulator
VPERPTRSRRTGGADVRSLLAMMFVEPVPPEAGTVTTTTAWAERRERISRQYERVALELFAELGYPDVTMDDIAEELGVSARTLFRYFPSKEEILLGVPRRSVQALLDELGCIELADDPVRALWNAFRDSSSLYGDNLGLLRLWRQAMVEAPASSARVLGERVMVVEALVSEICAEVMGVDPEIDVRPHVVAAALQAASMAVVRHWYEHGAHADLAVLYDSAYPSVAAAAGALGRDT